MNMQIRFQPEEWMPENHKSEHSHSSQSRSVPPPFSPNGKSVVPTPPKAVTAKAAPAKRESSSKSSSSKSSSHSGPHHASGHAAATPMVEMEEPAYVLPVEERQARDDDEGEDKEGQGQGQEEEGRRRDREARVGSGDLDTDDLADKMLPDDVDKGIFDVELKGGVKMGVTVMMHPGSVSFLLTTEDSDLARKLSVRKTKAALEKRLQTRMGSGKSVQVTFLGSGNNFSG